MLFLFWGGGDAGINDVLSEVLCVYVLNILVGVDFKDFFYNFCDGGRFLKKWKREGIVIC